MPGNHYGAYQQQLMIPQTYQELQEAQHARNMAMRAQSLNSNNPYYYPESDLRSHDNLGGLSLNGVQPNPYQGQGLSSLNTEMMQMQGQYWQPSLYESAYSNINSNINFAHSTQNHQSSSLNGQDMDMYGSPRPNHPDEPSGNDRTNNIN